MKYPYPSPSPATNLYTQAHIILNNNRFWSFGRLVVWGLGWLYIVAKASQQTGRCQTSPTLRGWGDWKI